MNRNSSFTNFLCMRQRLSPYKQPCNICFSCFHCIYEYWLFLTGCDEFEDDPKLVERHFFNKYWKNQFLEFHSSLKNYSTYGGYQMLGKRLLIGPGYFWPTLSFFKWIYLNKYWINLDRICAYKLPCNVCFKCFHCTFEFFMYIFLFYNKPNARTIQRNANCIKWRISFKRYQRNLLVLPSNL